MSHFKLFRLIFLKHSSFLAAAVKKEQRQTERLLASFQTLPPVALLYSTRLLSSILLTDASSRPQSKSALITHPSDFFFFLQ